MSIQTVSTPTPAHGASATGLRFDLRSPAVSLVAATIAAGSVLAAGTGGPRPLSLMAAAFLFLATVSDLRRLRIPNWLTFPALLLALAWHGATGGAAGLGLALAGVAAAFTVLVLPYATGFLGAGDVKAAMALGALLGAPAILTTLVWCAFLGGVAGLAVLLAHRGLGEMLRRWAASLGISFATRRFFYLPPAPDAPAARVLPFGFVLAFGVAACFAWGAPWA